MSIDAIHRKAAAGSALRASFPIRQAMAPRLVTITGSWV
jgi:hypothetical protein